MLLRKEINIVFLSMAACRFDTAANGRGSEGKAPLLARRDTSCMEWHGAPMKRERCIDGLAFFRLGHRFFGIIRVIP